MRRKLALVAGAAVGAAAALRLRRRPAVTSEPAPGEPAEELKRKLAEARDAEPADDAPPAEEPEPEVDVDEARRRVHEEARAALDEMERSGQGGG